MRRARPPRARRAAGCAKRASARAASRDYKPVARPFVRPHVSDFVPRARALLSVALAEGLVHECVQTAMRMAMGNEHSHARFRQSFKSLSGLGKKKRSALSNERNVRALYHEEQQHFCS